MKRRKSRADFCSGYLVQPADDTVRGEIDYRDARASAMQCRFRPGAGALTTVFQPTDLRAYDLPGASFTASQSPRGGASLVS